MHDLERLRTVTSNYEAFQGLRLVPTALPVAYGGAGALAGGALDGAVGLVGFLATVAVAGILSYLLGRWYERRYGVVRPTPEQRRAWATRSLGAVAVVAAAAIVGAWLEPAAPLFGLVTVATLGLYWRSAGGLRVAHVIALAAITLVSLLPLADVSDGAAWGTLFLTLAASFAVVGLFDHRYLSLTLPAPDQG